MRVLIGRAGAGSLVLMLTAVTACSGGGSSPPGSGPASRGCTSVALKPITVGSQPGPLVITPDGKTVYVANVNSGTVSPISVASSTAQRPIAVAGGSDGPDAIAITPDGKTLYVADMSGVVVPVRTATNTALEPVKVSQQPFAMAITPDGRTVYVVNYSSDDDPGFVTPIRTCAAG